MKLRSILVGLVVGVLIGGSLYAKGPEPEVNAGDVVDKDIQPQPTGIPRIISFQGMLKDNQGKPLNGEFKMIFKLYTQPTGGSPIWTEERDGVNVENGVYSVLLGEVSSLDNVAFDKSYWLEVEVDGDRLQPRYRLAASPYALGVPRVSRDCLWEESGNDIYRKDGNIGIGTTQPETPLDIRRDNEAEHGTFQVSLFNNVVGLHTGGGHQEMRFYKDNVGDPDYYNNPDASAIMTLKNNGNVGIGTTEPGQKLEVVGGQIYLNSGAPDAYFRVATDSRDYSIGLGLSSGDDKFTLYDNTAGASRLTIQTNGNIGIGTTEPAKDLHIQSSAPTLRLTDSDTGGDAEFYGGSGGIVIGADVNNEVPDDSIAFELSGSEKLRILNNGNIGIGTTEPTTRLTIKALGTGDDGPNDFIEMLDSNGNQRIYIGQLGDGSAAIRLNDNEGTWAKIRHDVTYFLRGNVGIGTAHPQHKLDVEGYVQAHGYYTGDIVFQKDGNKLWRMFEDEEGLYLESLKTGKVYRFVLQEIMNK
jgi:hypothetical protein